MHKLRSVHLARPALTAAGVCLRTAAAWLTARVSQLAAAPGSDQHARRRAPRATPPSHISHPLSRSQTQRQAPLPVARSRPPLPPLQLPPLSSLAAKRQQRREWMLLHLRRR